MRPVGAERRGIDLAQMALEGEEARPLAAQVPHPRRLVPRRRNSDRHTIHREERPSAAWKSSVSRISPNYAIRQSAKPRNPPGVRFKVMRSTLSIRRIDGGSADGDDETQRRGVFGTS